MFASPREPGWGGGGGARGAIARPTFCLNGMDMPVPPPKIWQSLGISASLPPPPKKKIVPAPLPTWVGEWGGERVGGLVGECEWMGEWMS